MAGFMKILLIYLFLSVAVTMWQPQIVFNGDSPSDQSILSMFNIKLNTATNDTYYVQGSPSQYQFQGASQNNTASLTSPPNIASSGSGFLTYADPILMIVGWFGTLLRFLFSPIIILTNGVFAGMPSSILLMIGVPLVIMFILGLITFIRSGAD